MSSYMIPLLFAGSNSVNVFLGLGLPWVISTCYHAVKKTKYIVYSVECGIRSVKCRVWSVK